MAKIASSFKCIICNQPLNFPNDISIIEFVIILLQFYRTHDLCENLGKPKALEKEETGDTVKQLRIKKKSRTKKGD